MNTIGFIILCMLLVGFVIGLIADCLNLGQLRNELPKTFQGWYDARRYSKSQQYTKVNTLFGWVSEGTGLIILLIFWFSGGFNLLDQWVRSLEQSYLISGLTYIGILIILRGILALPFSIYATFVIEERFGFNKTTCKTFIKDRVKGLILALIIGGPLIAAILVFFQYAGNNAWWACWLLSMAVALVLHYVGPSWIMPLFNRFEPLPPGKLHDAITAYAQSISFAVENIFVMDGSKRSGKSNAFFTGFGRNRRIVLFDTLIQRHEIEEIVAVLAHEMGHFKRNHILKMLIIGFLQTGLMFYILSFFLSYEGLFNAFYLEQSSVYVGLVLFGILYSPLEALTGVMISAMSRRHEYEADRFAVKTAPKSDALAIALKKLSVDNLSNLLPHPFYVFLHYSHPPVLERVRAIERRPD